MSTEDDDLSALIRRHATRHTAPDRLRAGIRTQVALEDARRSPLPPGRSDAPARRWFTFGWGTASASFALGMLCMALLIPLTQQVRLGESVDATLVTEHVRALRAGPLAEVLSSDRHTVKPWFQGRLDYAPPVFDLAGQGYPLVGGRIAHVHGAAVATLAYTHNRHVVDLFVWPSAEQRAPERLLQRGFNVVRWADGSMQYWAVSDMDRAEIDAFTQLWRQRAAAQ